MHAARAVEIKSVILYSGTEKVDMAGYSENVNLIMPVDCSPCGFKIEWPYSKKCMDFTVEEVYKTVMKCI